MLAVPGLLGNRILFPDAGSPSVEQYPRQFPRAAVLPVPRNLRHQGRRRNVAGPGGPRAGLVKTAKKHPLKKEKLSEPENTFAYDDEKG